jgi:DNA-binding LytR/AlgR family response regulator
MRSCGSMRVALYGKSIEKIQEKKEQITGSLCGENMDCNVDLYTEKQLLKTNLFQYDMVCLTDSFLELLGNEKRREVTFAWGKRMETCYVDDIYYVEAELKNVHIRYEKSETVVHMLFSQVEEILQGEFFIKIHRSYLVNCCHIQGMDDRTVCLKNGVVLPISKYRTEEVHQQYREYLQRRQHNH